MNHSNSSRPPHRFPARAALLGLGLAALCPRPAAAQGVDLILHTGDALSVSGLGTTGLYHGLPVGPPMSGYTSYTDDGNPNSSGNYAAVEIDGTASFALGAGGTITSQHGTALDAYGTGPVTVTGGAITGSDGTVLDTEGTGPVTVSGGTFNGTLYDGGSGSVTVSGGTFNEEYGDSALIANDASTGSVTVTGGTFNGGLDDGGSGPVTVSGGTFNGGQSDFGLFASGGPVTVSGGTFTAAGADNVALENFDSSVTITGGTFNGGAGGYGLESYNGYARVSNSIDLFGSGFSYTVNGVTTPITSGKLPTDPNYGVVGTISGTLLDGQALNATTFLNEATIEVNVGTPPAAPEPSQFAALGLGTLGLTGLAVKARKRRVA